DWSRGDRYTAQEIIPGLLLGPTSLTKKTELLARLGVTHLLGVQQTGTEELSIPSPPTSGQFSSLTLPFSPSLIGASDAPTMANPVLPTIMQAIDFSRQVRLQGGTLLVHCLTGMDQSPVIAAAILMD
ncbi:hypothetical protein BJ684DRAFT_895, partial [Piptocephalis cylindrospora]